MAKKKQAKEPLLQKRLTLKEKVTWSPLKKYELFNKVPWKLIIHIALIVFTTLQVITLDDIYASHARQQKKVFNNIFLGGDSETSTMMLFGIQDLKDHLETTVKNLRDIDNLLFQKVFNKDQILYGLKAYYRGGSDERVGDYLVNINNGLMPYINISDTNSLKSFTNKITKMIVSMKGLQTELYQNQNINPCVGWNIQMHYSFESLSRVRTSLETQSYRCDPHMSRHRHAPFFSPLSTNYFYCVVIFLLGLASLVQFIIYFYRVGITYQEAKVRYHANDVTSREQYERRRIELLRQTAVHSKSLKKIIKKNYSWEDLTVLEKLSFISFWSIFGVIGNIIQIFGSASLIYADLTQNTLEVLRSDTLFVGFGCFFAWIQIMYYLEFNQDLVVLSTILRKSLPRILSFYLFYAPLFIGFVVFCRAIFWRYPLFEGLGVSSITLFALQAGDEIFASFQQVHDDGYARQIVLFVFIIIFYTAMQNIFFAVVLEGFQLAQIQKQIDNDDPWTNKKLVDVLSKKRTHRLSLLEEDIEEENDRTEKAEEETRQKRSKSAPNSPTFVLEEDRSKQQQRRPTVIELENKRLLEFKEAMNQQMANFREIFKRLKRLKHYFLSSELLINEKALLKMRYRMKLQEISATLNYEFYTGKFRSVVNEMLRP